MISIVSQNGTLEILGRVPLGLSHASQYERIFIPSLHEDLWRVKTVYVVNSKLPKYITTDSNKNRVFLENLRKQADILTGNMTINGEVGSARLYIEENELRCIFIVDMPFKNQTGFEFSSIITRKMRELKAPLKPQRSTKSGDCIYTKSSKAVTVKNSSGK